MATVKELLVWETKAACCKWARVCVTKEVFPSYSLSPGGVGLSIGNYDLLIAVHALHQGPVLVTNNTREFRRVSVLRVEKWIEQE